MKVGWLAVFIGTPVLVDGYSYPVGAADVVEVRLQSPEFEPRKPDFGKLNRLKTSKEEIQRWN